MVPRPLNLPGRSFFQFGPRGLRGTGKTAWLGSQLADPLVFDLLESGTYQRLSAAPGRLSDRIPDDHAGWVVLDEIQRVPELLNEVHRLIEGRGLRFAMTGSSARKLRRGGANLLAGRARTLRMHPLTAQELGRDFDLERTVRFGTLPFACTTEDPASYLRDYVGTYLREEVQQEGLVREIGGFSRFLEAASFSQGAVLNMASVARECSVHAKVVESHFALLEDLLIAVRLPVFARRAKRRVIAHPKFYYFDAGVGERGLLAFEVKRSARVRDEDLASLLAFRSDYPMAQAFFVHAGNQRGHDRGIEIVPLRQALVSLQSILEARGPGPKKRSSKRRDR